MGEVLYKLAAHYNMSLVEESLPSLFPRIQFGVKRSGRAECAAQLTRLTLAQCAKEHPLDTIALKSDFRNASTARAACAHGRRCWRRPRPRRCGACSIGRMPHRPSYCCTRAVCSVLSCSRARACSRAIPSPPSCSLFSRLDVVENDIGTGATPSPTSLLTRLPNVEGKNTDQDNSINEINNIKIGTDTTPVGSLLERLKRANIAA